jgi:hypothetical protein
MIISALLAYESSHDQTTAQGQDHRPVPSWWVWRDHPAEYRRAAETDDMALEASREWKPTLVDKNYAENISNPADIGETGEEI